jgi:AcrR family transcriptional regulator
MLPAAMESRDGSPEPQAKRKRLIDAFTKVAAERGYEQVTIAEISNVAGVSRNDFYSHFASKRQCLGAAQEAFFERMIWESRSSVDHDREWPHRVREAVVAALDFIDETTSRARFFAVEVLVVGPGVVERQTTALSRAIPLLREGRRHSPGAAALPEVTEGILIGGVAQLLSNRLLAEEPLRVSRLAPEVVEIFLTPYLGAERARAFAA